MSHDPSQGSDHSGPEGEDDEGSAVDDVKFQAQQPSEEEKDEEKSSHTDSEATRPSLQEDEPSEADDSNRGSGTATSHGSFDSVDSLNVEGISLVKQDNGHGEEAEDAQQRRMKLISPDLLDTQQYLITASTPPLSTSMPSRKATPEPVMTHVNKHEEPEVKGEVSEQQEASNGGRQGEDETDHGVESNSILQRDESSITIEDQGDEYPETKEPDLVTPSVTLSITSPDTSIDQNTHEELNEEPEEHQDVTLQNILGKSQPAEDVNINDTVENEDKEDNVYNEKQKPIIKIEDYKEDINEALKEQDEEKDVAVLQDAHETSRLSHDEDDVYNRVDYNDNQTLLLSIPDMFERRDAGSPFTSRENVLEDKVPDKQSLIRFQLADADMDEQNVEIVDDVYSETYAPRETGIVERELYGSEQDFIAGGNTEDEDEHISSVSEHEDDGHQTYPTRNSKQDMNIYIYNGHLPHSFGDSFSQFEKFTRRSVGETDDLLSGYQDSSSVVSDVCSPRLESHRQSSLKKLKSKMPKFSTMAYSFKSHKPQAPHPAPTSTPWTVYGDFGGYYLNGQTYSQTCTVKKVSMSQL